MNSKGFKKTLLFATSVLVAVGLVACGNSKSSSSDTTKKDAGKLTVTMALSEDEWAVMKQDVIPKFEKENNVKVTALQIEAGDVEKKLEAMKSANKVDVDLIAQDVNKTASLVSKGLVEDLSSDKNIIPKETIGKIAQSGVFDGKTYFMPYRPNVEINFYNSTKFKEMGLKSPKTWDELYSTAKTMKNKDGLGRLALKIKMSGDVIEAAEFIRSAGGDPLVLNDKGSIEAFTFLQKLWPNLSENTLKASFDSTNGFLAKDEVYYAPNWPFATNIIVKDGGRSDILADSGFEGPKGQVKTLGGEVLGIPKGSPNKANAVKFIKYLESKEAQETLLKKNGWPSFRTDVAGAVEDWQKPYFEATQEALKNAQPLPNVPYWADVNKAINDALKETCIDHKDVKTTLDKYAAQIKTAKDNSAK